MRAPRGLVGVLLAAMIVAGGLPCFAQVPLGELIFNLIDQEFALGAGAHTFHFDEAVEVARGLNTSLSSQLTSAIPLSTASGGVAFEWDAESNSFARKTESFGPIFAERAETLGQGKYNLGWSYLHFEFDEIDGLPLSTGQLEFDVLHEDRPPFDGTTLDNPVEGDLVAINLAVNLSTETLLFFGSVGITDRFDIGVAIPLVTVDLDVVLDARIKELSTSGSTENGLPIHRFPGPSTEARFSDRGSKTALGDVIVRAKYNLTKQEGRGLAAAAEIRLPTGADEDLVGTGGTQFKLLLIGSGSFGKLSPHVNLGYTLTSGSGRYGEVPEQSHLALGFDVPLGEKITLAADIIGRTLYDATALSLSRETHLYRLCGAECLRTPIQPGEIRTTERGVLASRPDDLAQVLGTAGVKIRLPTKRDALVTFSLLSSLSSDGLQDTDLIALIGFDLHF